MGLASAAGGEGHAGAHFFGVAAASSARADCSSVMLSAMCGCAPMA
jgi:hypothetical protein